MVVTEEDRHYTPANLAQELVARISLPVPSTVADLSAGDGALLAAAQSRWPDAHLVAVDTDTEALRLLSIQLPRADCICTDALALERLSPVPQVILLNPPFSHRGGRVCNVELNGHKLKCSPAMAFVIKSVSLLSKGSQVAALLPANCLHSEKDKAAWALVKTMCAISKGDVYDRNTFEQCYPTSVLVHVTVGGVLGENCRSFVQQIEPASLVYFYRGTLPVSRADMNGATRLLHTTDLGSRHRPVLRCQSSGADLTGPVVLLPRVGVCRSQHLVFRSLHSPTRLSECVFALWGSDENTTRGLYRTLVREYEWLETSYHGTCAPYITVGDLKSLLARFGWSAQQVRPGWIVENSPTRFAK